MPETTSKAVYNVPWHNDACVREHVRIDKRTGSKHFWCSTHKQSAYERPVKKEVVFTYGDGETERYVYGEG